MSRRYRNFCGQEIPTAKDWQLYTCGHCPNLHVVLFDDAGEAFAEMVLGKDSLDQLFKEGTNFLAKIRLENIKRQNEDRP